jgi:hypothetical protein
MVLDCLPVLGRQQRQGASVRKHTPSKSPRILALSCLLTVFVDQLLGVLCSATPWHGMPCDALLGVASLHAPPLIYVVSVTERHNHKVMGAARLWAVL